MTPDVRHADHFADLSAMSVPRSKPEKAGPAYRPERLIPAYFAFCLSLILVRLAPSARRRRQAVAAAEAMSRTR